jgi:putative membrane-bound dehydrogenase-like protein
VFEDADHDGTFEKRTVFASKLNLVSGLEVGFGGVWVGAAPYLLFIPDANDDLVPDGRAEVLLDGFGYEDTHETLNAFTWGPDGWLYGTPRRVHAQQGRQARHAEVRAHAAQRGRVALPPDAARVRGLRVGHVEPWGVDFDDRTARRSSPPA